MRYLSAIALKINRFLFVTYFYYTKCNDPIIESLHHFNPGTVSVSGPFFISLRVDRPDFIVYLCQAESSCGCDGTYFAGIRSPNGRIAVWRVF